MTQSLLTLARPAQVVPVNIWFDFCIGELQDLLDESPAVCSEGYSGERVHRRFAFNCLLPTMLSTHHGASHLGVMSTVASARHIASYVVLSAQHSTLYVAALLSIIG